MTPNGRKYHHVVRPELSDFYAYHESLRQGYHDEVVQEFINRVTQNRPKVDTGTGQAYWPKLIPQFLNWGWYIEVGALLWGKSLFTVEPQSVQDIWRAISQSSECLIMGAGSMGKSYSIAAWCLLDWLRDPTQTCFKVVSLTREHAKRNAFASIQMLHNSSVIKLPGERKSTTIQVDDNNKQGIHLEALRQGEDGKGKLQGIHPHPRSQPHEYFQMTRVRIVIDEAEEAPAGVWADVDNFLTSKFDNEHTKVIGAANPRKLNSRFGMRCKPEKGWAMINLDKDFNWKSELGWDVVRLDGARCENVTRRKVVYPGLLTWDGFSRYVALGETHPDYWTMARGIFPPQGVSMAVIPGHIYERSFGTYSFKGAITPCASADLAFEGDDRVVVAMGRCGEAIGWTDLNGKYSSFEEPKKVLQIDGLFELPKLDTIPQARQIKGLVQSSGVASNWLIVDRTGVGTGVHDVLKVEFGLEVMGLHFGAKATQNRLFVEDSKPAEELYDGVVTELVFSLSRMMEFDLVKLGKGVPRDQIAPQVTDRLYRQAGLKSRVEPKSEYKKRNGESPDHLDALTMLAHLVRLRYDNFQSRMSTSPIPQRKRQPVEAIVESLQFVDMVKD